MSFGVNYLPYTRLFSTLPHHFHAQSILCRNPAYAFDDLLFFNCLFSTYILVWSMHLSMNGCYFWIARMNRRFRFSFLFLLLFYSSFGVVRFVNRHRYTIRPAHHCHWLYALEWSASIIFRISITPTRDGIFHESHTSLNVTKRQHTLVSRLCFSYHHIITVLTFYPQFAHAHQHQCL